MPEVAYGSLPFDEAIAYFRSKGYALSPEGWRDLWQEAHARAFTVARVTEMDVIEDIRTEVQKALDAGTSLKQFQVDLRKTLERKGWFAPSGVEAEVTLPDGTVVKRLTPWRLETVYRTNLQTAYSVGRYKQMEEVKDARPYWQYMGIRDEVTRPAHAEQFGKVYHADHPFWDEWYPPNGFNCRCYVKTLSGRQMDERGLTEETRGVADHPDEGWRYNVGKEGLAAWRPDLSGYGPKARAVLERTLQGGPQ